MVLSHGSSTVAVTEVPLFTSDSLPPFPHSSRHSTSPIPSPIHVFALSSGWVCAGLLQTRALCHPAPSHYHPHHLSPLSLSAYFPLFSPSCTVLCDLLKPGRHVITLLDTKNSRQPVFSEEKEENEQGKQSDTSSRLLGHSV